MLCWQNTLSTFSTTTNKSIPSRYTDLLNPSTPLQEDIIHNLLRATSVQWPRSQQIPPKWHLSVVLKGLMKPPFTENGSDRNISLELLSYKKAFLVTLATCAWGSELVALSWAEHNIIFTELASGAKQFYIRMLSKFIPKNSRPGVIPKPFSGITKRDCFVQYGH